MGTSGGMNGKKEDKWGTPNDHHSEKDEGMKLWGILLFGLIGATATTFAVGQLRRTADWAYQQFNRAQSSGRRSSYRSAFQEEARKKYQRRMQEEYEEELERVERIRRMQSVFNRERNKFKRSYESWRESGPGQYHQHFQREDWYWKADASFGDHQQTHHHRRSPRTSHAVYHLSHHYAVLGLDRLRSEPYTEAEIKTAFRAKAKEYHPDQNQHNKEAAEAKFKEVLTSYETIKKERKDSNQ